MSTLETNSIGKYSGNNVSIDDALNLKSYTTAQRNALTSVAGDTIYNSDDNKPQYYDGSAWQNMGSGVITVDYLVVAGGGSGGSRIGAGGGAGGLRSTIGNTGGGGSLESSINVTAGSGITVTIGAGGAAVTSNGAGIVGNNGSNSVFSTVTSVGGGGGGAYFNPTAGNGLSGGSGGGGAYANGTGGSGTANQGYAGGNYVSGIASAGGGGAGEVAPGTSVSQDGGDGVICNILSSSDATTESVGEVVSTNVYYAGGGGGSPSGTGGLGGASNGTPGDNSNASNADANTGGGGGGARNASDTTNVISGAGGSGVVILRYADAFTISVGAGLTAGSTYTSGGYKVTPIKSGTGTVSWS